jgi:hypothetical protein
LLDVIAASVTFGAAGLTNKFHGGHQLCESIWTPSRENSRSISWIPERNLEAVIGALEVSKNHGKLLFHPVRWLSGLRWPRILEKGLNIHAAK